MPTFKDLFEAIRSNPLAALLTLSLLINITLTIRSDKQERRVERLLRETMAVEKRCAEEKEKNARENQIQKDSIYLVNLRFANAANERLTKLKEQVNKIKK